jgi:acyl-CoA synthetase (AMP-forming)/AMP-acid ligase II
MENQIQRLLQDSLIFSAAEFPAKTALVVEGVPYSYEQLLTCAQRFASFLQYHGLKRGDRVAIYMDNTWPCAVAIYGALLAGGVFLVINPQTKSDKLLYILNDSQATAFVSDGHLTGVFSDVLGNAVSVQTIICSGKQPHADTLVIHPFDNCIAEHQNIFYDNKTISPDLAALIYTSGSTGDSKGVMMTHRSMVFTAGSLIQYLRLNSSDRIINVLPFAFDYGLYQLLMAVRLGATLVLERSFTYPALVINRIQSEQITVFPGVPTIYMTLIGMHNRNPLCFPSVTRITNTAASLPSEIVPKLKEIFPNALVFRMYGLTECKRVCYLEPELIDKKPESVGKAIPGTEVFVLNEHSEPVKPGETGILYVRGDHVMVGYWNKPALTNEMIKEGKLPGERILCTHDFFSIDEDGCLYFKGRSDDIIKTRGEKVSPIEVENCLYGISGIREAAVIGVSDSLLGEAIQAFIALESDSKLTEKEIKAICLSKLENFMVPKDIIFLPELPKTATGKIQKKALRNR